jgi:hypothetical protein
LALQSLVRAVARVGSGYVTMVTFRLPLNSGALDRHEHRLMRRITAVVVMLAASSLRLHAQIPKRSSADPVAIEQERHNYLDSLAAGRQRWTRAGMQEYRLQSHVECFCLLAPEDTGDGRSLLTIRDGRVVARNTGTVKDVHWRLWTVDSLFAQVEEDLKGNERSKMRLELDRVFGFPLRYHAETQEIPDVWITFKVDTFAIVRSIRRKGAF